LAKLIATGETRDVARHRALAALRHYPILGIRTNIPLLIALLEHPRFVAGEIDTGFLDAEGEVIRSGLPSIPPPEVLAVATVARAEGPSLAATRRGGTVANGVDPWSSLRGARV
jgi:acetyl/propionyl-CoA carboxylase alpha subunit